MNDKLIKEIEDEMAICKVRIHEARVEIAKLNERQLNYDDRLTMLQNLFLIAKEREEIEETV